MRPAIPKRGHKESQALVASQDVSVPSRWHCHNVYHVCVHKMLFPRRRIYIPRHTRQPIPVSVCTFAF